jgi:hypothetical protein
VVSLAGNGFFSSTGFMGGSKFLLQTSGGGGQFTDQSTGNILQLKNASGMSPIIFAGRM